MGNKQIYVCILFTVQCFAIDPVSKSESLNHSLAENETLQVRAHHKAKVDSNKKIMLTNGTNVRANTSIYRSSTSDACPRDSPCVLPVQCPAHLYEDIRIRCTISGEQKGYCCSTGQNHTSVINKKVRGHSLIDIDPLTLNMLSTQCRIERANLQIQENHILTSGHPAIIRRGTPSYGHFRNTRVFGSADLHEVMNVATKALEIALATRAFKEQRGISVKQLEYGMIHENLRPTPLGSSCRPRPMCHHIPEKYRRIDGSCNNIKHPSWGMPLTPYSRLLPPSYLDGIWLPRVSESDGHPLASPRLISTTVFADEDRPNMEYTLMMMQFGQFLSHDITQSIDMTYQNGTGISCCDQSGMSALPPEFKHYSCMPIQIPIDDYFYSQFKQGCMNFVRSVLAPKHDCTLGYSEQMNKITHFLDGSVIYGSTPDQTHELRSFEGGMLKVFNDFGRELLPLSKNPDACLTMDRGSACFASGDTRTNQMISLAVLHTVFMREHNRVARILHQINPSWQDELLFLEARRIVTAELQVITYKEYLPTLLGDSAMQEFNIALTYEDYSYDYDQRIEPSITNEFAAAAFRFGHSMVEGLLKLYGMKKEEEFISIPEIMFYPARLRKREILDEILSSLTTEPIQDVDNNLSDAMTKYMFRSGNPFGVDIASLNIQRGRDHGLRPYNDYRELVGLPKIRSFREFGPIGARLRRVYASVDDVDLWVGGLLEPKAPGSVLGYVFRDIVADQFARLQKGDKYFFDHDPSVNPSHFNLKQINELRKVTMSRLICDNSDRYLLARMSPNSFRMPGTPGNEIVDCEGPEIPRVNLEYWHA